jgi:hypothetical protein
MVMQFPGPQKQELCGTVYLLLQPNAARILQFYALEHQTFFSKTATSLSRFSSSQYLL